jgi:hypothetical protein
MRWYAGGAASHPSMWSNGVTNLDPRLEKRSRATTPASRISAALALLLAVFLGACGHDSSERDRYIPLYSPNGEPLSGGPLGRPACKDALSGWFDRVDAKHAGRIDRETYLADTRRQFAAMDLEKNGLIDPAELAAYRAPYAVVVPAEPKPRPGQSTHSRPDGGATRSDQADPVMIADVNLRNQVSLDDFLAYENRKFTELNTSHDGLLRREEVLAMCNVPH